MATNFINNKDLLIEIHKSKKSYCEQLDPKYAEYDIIIDDLSEITSSKIIEAKLEKASSMSVKGETPIDPETFSDEDIIWRVMTFDHIPIDPERKRKAKNGKNHAKTPFPPFKHYVIRDGKYVEVCRSHWDGDFEIGNFSPDKGRFTDKLGKMIQHMVNKYSIRGNWRGYSYNDEMRGHAITHLCQVGLQFDESKSSNPFSFYTTVISHCFTRILNLEKKNQDIRDELRIIAGEAPSFSRQVENEIEFWDEPVRKPGKPGRPKKVK